jgi:FtsZ-binding cell division protein ZapB
MPDKKPTDAEIVKALEEHYKQVDKGYSTHLEYGGKGDEHEEKYIYMLRDVLDLINRLQARVEYYKKNRNKYQDDVMYLSKQLDNLQAENERLKETTKNMSAYVKGNNWGLVSFVEFCKNLKAEAYKECIEKVKEIITEIYNKHIFGSNDLTDEEKDAVINFSDDVTSRIDNFLKELVGNNDES